jgi:thioredoxin reductase
MTNYKNIIIGAGPAGIQLAYYFKENNIPYLVLEKSQMCGSFFNTYPLSGKLISINKRHTGSDIADFKLRHDWNSLISNDIDLLFTKYSKDYYPDHNDLVRYLNDYAKVHKLNIKYGMNVNKIKKDDKDTYTLEITNDKGEQEIYTTEKLIVATGLSKANLPNMLLDVKEKIKHYADFEKDYFKNETNLAKYENKSLIIFGNGNAAYELGNLLNPYCSRISIMGRKPKDWSISTHYSGDLRSVYLPFLDTFLLKSLNSFDHTTGSIKITQESDKSKYKISYYYKINDLIEEQPIYSMSDFDHVIFCTGWKFDNSIFDFNVELTTNDKYPKIKPHYESSNNKNLYFIGSLMHSLDFKKSSGGFIHGFRYLIKNFVNINYELGFNINVFRNNYVNSLAKQIYNKINYTSPMYQMYGEIVDFFYFDKKTKEIIYYNNVSINLVLNGYFKMNTDQLFILSLEYNKKIITDIHGFDKTLSSVGDESSAALLHPILRVYNYIEEHLLDLNYTNLESDNKVLKSMLIDEIHFDEDTYANFTDFSKYYEKLFRTLKMFL